MREVTSIHDKIKQLRVESGLTLKELSEKTELSQGFLSMIENGNANLAITSLKKIAHAFNIEINYFFQEPSLPGKYHVAVEDRPRYWMQSTDNEFKRLSGDFPSRQLEPLIVTLQPNQKKDYLDSHEGEEFYYVLSGSVNFYIEDKKYFVKEGETMHFPSNLKHEYENPYSVEAVLLCIMTPKLFN